MLFSCLCAREVAPDKPRPLRRDEYAVLVEQGRFEDEHVELLEGVIVEMSPQGKGTPTPSSGSTSFCAGPLWPAPRARAERSFIASETSQPEPDLAVARIARRLEDSHPHEAFLIVEVAQTSLAKDRGVKARLYASAGVPEYWIVDLQSMTIEGPRRQGAFEQQSSARLNRGSARHEKPLSDAGPQYKTSLGDNPLGPHH